ncbi:MAG: class I SAM-dependent methyltransferase [Desulfomonile tiedjei]|nr:class I SAM-dependent methyltransferase [Desulfomonile tiedjei]
MSIPCGKLLDVGCASGEFLALMSAMGWEALGVEPDPEAAKSAVEVLNMKVIPQTLEAAQLTEACFDLITLNHTIEHVHDPVNFLGKCRQLLKSGGYLAIITPNIDSLGHKAFEDFWVHLDIPRHLHLFSLSSLEACVTRAGFKVVWRTTGAGLAVMTHRAGLELRARGQGGPRSSAFANWVSALSFYARQEGRRYVGEPVGEELVMVVRRSE